MQQTTIERLPLLDRCTVEEVGQFLKWAGPVNYPKPTAFLATQWYCGLLTMEEGRRIEADLKLAHFLQK